MGQGDAEGNDRRMIEFLKKVKRTIVSHMNRAKVRAEAARAFRYDKAQFMANAGALHLDRKSAARAEIVMGYHVLEKGLTMPRRRLGFGKGAIVHLINLIESFGPYDHRGAGRRC